MLMWELRGAGRHRLMLMLLLLRQEVWLGDTELSNSRVEFGMYG